MEFIDNTGHIFSLTSFDSYPTGYEYETFDYVFYLEDEYVRRLSVNNFYIKPIRALLHKDSGSLSSLSIKIDSGVFKLIGSKTIQQKTSQGIFNIEFDEQDESFKSELSLDDIYIIEDDDDILITFYVIGTADSPATWTSNILIDAEYNGVHEYCPITVGGVFYDEQEELIINGRNMGVYFPKDIIKAVYGSSVYNDTINEALYNSKVKEYMMNYMKLHGETGNLDHIKSSLKFFGWGDKVKLVQLVRTDNNIISQYIRDFLSTENDLLIRFDAFEHSGLISLYVPINGETGEEYHPDYSNDFWGEMKPELEDYMNKLVNVRYDEQDITYQKKYFDYLFTELMLKVSCLRYFYQKYFLPMHSMCLSASVSTQVFANDIKYVTKPFIKLTEVPEAFEADRTKLNVIFPDNNTLYAYTQERYIDDNCNEFKNYIPEDRYHDIDIDVDVYYINDVCVSVPIKFETNNIDVFKCHLILERLGGTIMYESDFSFSNEDSEYNSFVIYPKIMNDRLSMNYWINKHYCIHLLVNDVWYDYEFEMKVPELHIQLGKLKYKYNHKMFRQVNEITDDGVDFQSFMYIPSLIDVQNINFPQNVVDYTNDGILYKFIDMYRESPSIPSPFEAGTIAKKYYNRVHYYKLLDEHGMEIQYIPAEDEDKLTQEAIQMYKKIFNSDGSQKMEYKVGSISYDVYLMHDSIHPEDYKGILSEEELSGIWYPKWYVVLISRETIDAAQKDSELLPPVVTFPQGYNMNPVYVSSDDKWLINRMEYVDVHGINRFKSSDIIVGTINNVELPFILTHGSKWVISPFSLGMQSDSEVTSTTNTFLMSLGGDNIGYDKGYYNITVRYSLDGVVQHQLEHRARILVTK